MGIGGPSLIVNGIVTNEGLKLDEEGAVEGNAVFRVLVHLGTNGLYRICCKIALSAP
jgi:hypothetical protein